MDELSMRVSHEKYVRHCGKFEKKFDQHTDGSKFDLSQVGKFKMPMFSAMIKTYDFVHSLNTILAGDHALKYENWLVFDPQTELFFEKGKPNIPHSIFVISMLVKVPSSDKDELLLQHTPLIRFIFDSIGDAYSDYYYPTLILERQYATKNTESDQPNFDENMLFYI